MPTRNVCFVVDRFERRALDDGDIFTEESYDLIDQACKFVSANGSLVVAVPDEEVARQPGKIRADLWKARREDMISEILDQSPDLVVALGVTALQALVGKGNATQSDHLRRTFVVDGLGDIPCVHTYGLDQVAASPGYAKWIKMDLLAAVRGHTETNIPSYTVVHEGHPSWNEPPPGIKGAEFIGLDLETYPGLDPWAPDARIRMAIVSWRSRHAMIFQCPPDSSLPPWLVEMIEDGRVEKWGSNIKFDYHWLRRFGVYMENMCDTSTAEHVIDERNPQKSLKSIAFTYAPWLGDYSREQKNLVTMRGGWEYIKDEEMYDYAACDGDASFSAAAAQRKLLEERGLVRPYRISMNTYRALAAMEHNGMCIDLEENRHLDHAYKEELAILRDELAAEFGPINPNSPQQVKKALLEVVPGIDLRFDKKGQWLDDNFSTENAVLCREAKKHPIIGKLLEYRRMYKRHSNYVKKMREIVTVHGDLRLVHGSFRTDRVETFRLSSTKPNLQNIPRNFETDNLTEAEIEKINKLNIKRQFISRFPGGLFLEADESQLEIRVAAWLSGDKKLLAAIESQDLHRETASMLLGKPADKVTKDERQRCKTLNFLILFQGGARKLAADLGVSKQQAQSFINQYFDTFPELAAWIQGIKERVKVDLSVEVPFGYRRYFYKPLNWNTPPGWRVERQAVNTPIQCTAGVLVQIAMYRIQMELEERNLRSKLISQVHDSVAVDTHPDELDTVAEICRRHLEDRDLSEYGVVVPVPLVADIEVGKTWASKASLDEEEA